MCATNNGATSRSLDNRGYIADRAVSVTSMSSCEGAAMNLSCEGAAMNLCQYILINKHRHCITARYLISINIYLPYLEVILSSIFACA